MDSQIQHQIQASEEDTQDQSSLTVACCKEVNQREANHNRQRHHQIAGLAGTRMLHLAIQCVCVRVRHVHVGFLRLLHRAVLNM